MRFIFCFHIVLFLFSASASFAQDEVLFVGGAPLDTYQPRVIVPLLKEAFKRNGIHFTAKNYPSTRALELSNSGEADGELHRVYDFHVVSKGRYPNLVRIDCQLMSVYRAVFSRDARRINDSEELKGYRVAYQRGRKAVLHDLGPILGEESLLPKNSDLTAFKMLAEGRVDYVVSESFEGQRMIASNPEFKRIKEVGRLKEARIYAYMHKKHTQLAKAIAATLEEMKRDGTYQKIVDNVRASILAGS